MADRLNHEAVGLVRLTARCLEEITMELNDLITELQAKLDDADLALDAENVDEAREALRAAKDMLDAEFLRD